MRTISSCLIIGAGLAGLMAATVLQAAGLSVTVVDKARGVGGRMATRRLDQAVFDHGAQYFTARDPRFLAYVQQWQQAGLIMPWADGFSAADGTLHQNGETRYRGTQGMTSPAKHLAQHLHVHLNEQVTHLQPDHLGWEAHTVNGKVFAADAVILTAPVPQALALLDAGDILLPAAARTALEAIAYNPCFAVLAMLNAPSQIPAPGGMWLSGDPIHWLADNQQKGISPVPSVTIHAGGEFSRHHFEADKEAIGQQLIAAAADVIGSQVIGFQVQRWRYSQPTRLHDQPFLAVDAPAPLLFAGDAFAGPRVEGAALSGLAAATYLKETYASN